MPQSYNTRAPQLPWDIPANPTKYQYPTSCRMLLLYDKVFPSPPPHRSPNSQQPIPGFQTHPSRLVQSSAMLSSDLTANGPPHTVDRTESAQHNSRFLRHRALIQCHSESPGCVGSRSTTRTHTGRRKRAVHALVAPTCSQFFANIYCNANIHTLLHSCLI